MEIFAEFSHVVMFAKILFRNRLTVAILLQHPFAFCLSECFTVRCVLHVCNSQPSVREVFLLLNKKFSFSIHWLTVYVSVLFRQFADCFTGYRFIWNCVFVSLQMCSFSCCSHYLSYGFRLCSFKLMLLPLPLSLIPGSLANSTQNTEKYFDLIEAICIFQDLRV